MTNYFLQLLDTLRQFFPFIPTVVSPLENCHCCRYVTSEFSKPFLDSPLTVGASSPKAFLSCVMHCIYSDFLEVQFDSYVIPKNERSNN